VNNIPEVEMQRGMYSKYHSTESNVAYMGWSEKFKNRSNLTPFLEIPKYRSNVSSVPSFA
jgi:adenine C2-methylase RlmN of 23S rRNA A2503 and tRNA A37